MAKVNIIRWDDSNFLPKLLDADDTAMVNSIDVTGSSGDLKLGPTDATNVLLGKTGGNLIMSGASFFKADALWQNDIRAIFGDAGGPQAALDYDAATGKLLISGSNEVPVHVLGAILSASTGLKVTGSADLPGQTSFLLDGQAVSTVKFTAANLSRLFNGSNVDDLHAHAIASSSLTSSLLIDADLVGTYKVGGPAGNAVTGTQVVYLSGGSNLVDLADADAVVTSRLIGVASGSTSVTYASGSEVPVYTFYGDRFGGFAGLTSSLVYYLSSTPGSITKTPPVGNGRNIVQVGIATSATEFLFQPDIVVRGLG